MKFILYTHHRLCTDLSHLEQVNRKLYNLMETSVDGYTLRDIECFSYTPDSKVQVSSASKNRFLDFFFEPMAMAFPESTIDLLTLSFKFLSLCILTLLGTKFYLEP